jgi:spore coat protein A
MMPRKSSLVALTLFLLLTVSVWNAPGTFAQVGTQVPLNPKKIPQFVDPLPHFAGLRVNARAGGNMTVTMKPTQQIAVSTGTKLAGGTVTAGGAIGLANLWAYEILYGGTTYGPHWPAFTIEAERNTTGANALNVTYVNALSDQSYSDVGLIVDQTLHWADPFMEMPLFTPYTGEPPAVVHLHGGEVPPLSDGGPDSWFTPGNALKGHAYNPNPYSYPNTQEAATLWFHDHALGVTRLNVYAGMAGFYFLRDPNEDTLQLPGWSGDDLVQEVAPPGTSGVFNPNPYLPEIEIAIQGRMFDTTGKLYFPNLPTNPTVHPFWTPEFVGDVITVNGKTWPYLSVAPRKYRFRLLNGSNARFYELSFGKKGPAIIQIGTDGGFLDAPVEIAGKLILGPGERADVIIDFTNFAGQTLILDNTARTPYPGGAPVTGSTTGRIMQFVVNGTMVSAADPANVGSDLSVIPGTLKTNVKLTDFAGAPASGVTALVVKKRQLTLNEVIGPGGPLEVLVNNTKWSGLSLGTTVRTDFTEVANSDGSNTYYSETMDEGTTEIWQIINMTADAHPIHLHLVQFQLMSRQPFNARGYLPVYDAAFPGGVYLGGYGPPLNYNANQRPGDPIPTIGGNPDVTPYLIGAPLPANPNEKGWKDTFIMYPGEVTTVIARWAPTDKAANLDPTVPANEMWFPFDPNGGHGYVWHCHIIDHEDNEMMRPYNVTLNPARP